MNWKILLQWRYEVHALPDFLYNYVLLSAILLLIFSVFDQYEVSKEELTYPQIKCVSDNNATFKISHSEVLHLGM